MSQHTIVQFPAHLDLASALEFTGVLATLPADYSIALIDFSRFSWAEPFGMLVTVQALQQLRKRLPTLTLAPINLPQNDAEGYAAHVGFFEGCEFNVAKPYGQAKGSSIYLPITRIENPSRLHASVIDERSLGLAQKLTQREDGELVRTLRYSFTEIIRNVAEHAESPDYWLCAQYWQSRGVAEIALVDSGRGLRASLSNNPYVRDLIPSDEVALKYALMPGVSGRRWGKQRHTHDEWANTGYGLYMNYRICDEGGSFFIASGSKGLYRKKGEDNVYYDYHLPGVALRLRMRVEALQDFPRLRDQFLADAKREAKQIEGGVLPTGDKMSQMLRTGFAASQEDA